MSYRAAVLTALFVGEVALLAALTTSAVVGHAGRVAGSSAVELTMVLSVAVALAVVLLGGPAQRTEVRLLLDAVRRAQRAWVYLPAHLAAFAALAWLTMQVGEHSVPEKADTYYQLLYAAWLGLAALGLAFWGAVALPERAWRTMCDNGLDAALAGVAVAAPAAAAFRLPMALWEHLGGATLAAVRVALAWIYPEVVFDPERLSVGTPAFRVRVYAGCGGYEGMAMIALFLFVYAAAFRRELRWPQALLLFPLAVGLMWLANVARIVALIAVGDGISKEVAIQGFHAQAGWVFFTAISLGLVAGSRKVAFFTRPSPEEPPEPALTAPSPPAAPCLVPLLALLATALVTGAFTADFDYLYPLRVLAVAATLYHFRAEYARWDWRPSWSAAAVGVGVFALWLALESPFHQAAEARLLAGLESMPPGWRVAWLFCRAAGSTLTVPLAEELAFRGYLTRRLVAADVESVPLGRFSWFSFLVSSALFGAMHGRWLAGTLAGMAYALALYKRRSLADAVFAHAVTNGLIATLALSGRWSLWA